MATYFAGNLGIPGGEDGGHSAGAGGGGLGLHTMVLMNPTTYVHFNSGADQDPPPNSSSAAAAGNFILFNPSTAGNFLASNQAPPQHFHDHDHNNNNTNSVNNVSAVLHGFIPRVYGTPVEAARETPRANQQGLSLSLYSEQQRPSFVVSGMQGSVLSSKYLKAAQELLDEVATVNENNTSTENKNRKCLLSNKNGDEVDGKSAGESTRGAETGDKVAAELTVPERQEIQMKKARLVTMLDEVDQRYKQYHNQMRIIVSSFEQAAGSGSAKTYTSLALKTISKQFRCLNDAIKAQIKALNKSLGGEEREEDEEEGKAEGGSSSSSSRLKFVDHHLRQQRALQQLGMIHHSNNNNNAWRPQRGLPERAVSVLRSWLFEHFLHPYPKDSDKVMLAKQTGLTRSQVSNWFINARVRLWKPMVEEMYLEEMKEHEKNNGSSKKKVNPNEHQDKEDSMPKSVGYSDKKEKSHVSEAPQNSLMLRQDSFMNNNGHGGITMAVPVTASASATGFSISGASELEGITQGSPKRVRINEILHSPASVPSAKMDFNIPERFRDEKEFSFLASNTNFMGGNFGAYPIEEAGRFEAEEFTPSYSGNNNGVSLTLGLPHCESFSVSAPTHQNFFPNQNIQIGRDVEMSEPNEFGAISTSESHSSAAAYNTISLQNQRRFSAQLLPDFVT
ncbi:PREDICTED: BEL1-like homeodomain protein 1 [Tarenaya hassleriana]|uniref:BEL1-like homeodomain protein 1 n=1 Tax=Tarenaya hassleriana TaxID=28532 RepID=UPI00053C8AB5|nr:PREDICTED: BEL1-like homeodomain protein 1 [Tarenaya hassleriana]